MVESSKSFCSEKVKFSLYECSSSCAIDRRGLRTCECRTWSFCATLMFDYTYFSRISKCSVTKIQFCVMLDLGS